MRIAPRRYDDQRDLAIIEASLSLVPDAPGLLFERGCALEDLGQTEAAAQAYLTVLQRDRAHLGALTNFGSLLLHRGEGAMAEQFFAQALACHPHELISRVNLGRARFEQDDAAGAAAHYAAALATDPNFFAAHQSLAMLYEATGDAQRAETHWQAAFARGAATQLPYAGPEPPPVRLLLIVSGRGGDVVAHRFLDERRTQTTLVMADGFDGETKLPPHDVIFNGIGDADRCRVPLERLRGVLAQTKARVINDPERVLATGRDALQARFGAIAGVVVPRTERIARAVLNAAFLDEHGWRFPLLIRAPGYQAGRYFEKIDVPDQLEAALGRVPGSEVIAIEYLDARGPDGNARKYRVLFIGGKCYPLHLAIGAAWKIHYFSADMTQRSEHRQEERRFLDDMRSSIGSAALRALEAIGAAMGLDYAGVDFAVDAHGRVLVFEANATMAIFPPPAGEQWDYRRPAYTAAVRAVRALISA